MTRYSDTEGNLLNQDPLDAEGESAIASIIDSDSLNLSQFLPK